jgi:hypothetical protein
MPSIGNFIKRSHTPPVQRNTGGRLPQVMARCLRYDRPVIFAKSWCNMPTDDIPDDNQ